MGVGIDPTGIGSSPYSSEKYHVSVDIRELRVRSSSQLFPYLVQQTHRHEKDSVPVRWGAVVAAVLGACLVAVIATGVWYVRAVTLPKEDHIAIQQNLDETQLTDISYRMVRVETVLQIR
jgi:hypothetical protein